MSQNKQDNAKLLKVLEGMPNLIKLHENLLEKSILIRTAFGLKNFLYQLIQEKGGLYSLADNKTSKYVIKNRKPAEIKQYVKSNAIDPDEIFEGYYLFDHHSMEKYAKYDKIVDDAQEALENTEQLEKSIQYKISDYYIRTYKYHSNTIHYKLYKKNEDNTTDELVIDGPKKEVADKIIENGIDPDSIYNVELLKYLFK